MVRLLEIRAIGGAGPTSLSTEPAVDPRARALDVVLLPHMGSATIEGRIAMGEVIINIKTFADGHRPPDRIFGSML
jgi:glyoxylate reductase